MGKYAKKCSEMLNLIREWRTGAVSLDFWHIESLSSNKMVLTWLNDIEFLRFWAWLSF